MSKKHVFRVIFVSQGTQYEIYAKQVHQADMYGFVEVEGLIFGEKSAVLVDPSEERLKAEFSGVQSTFIPMHSVIRIDQVDKKGAVKITEVTEKSSTVTPFPLGIHSPGADPAK